MRDTLKVIAVVLLIAAVAVGGWLGGWWLQEDATNRRTGIANESLARQQARLDEAIDKAADVLRIDVQISQVSSEQAAPLVAQRVAIVDQFCAAVGGLTGRLTLPSSTESLALQECSP